MVVDFHQPVHLAGEHVAGGRMPAEDLVSLFVDFARHAVERVAPGEHVDHAIFDSPARQAPRVAPPIAADFHVGDFLDSQEHFVASLALKAR